MEYTESTQAVPPPKQFQLQRQGGDQELPKNYLVNDSYSQSFKPTLLEPRQYKSRVNEGSSSFRRPDETWQYNDDSPFAHDSERKWRRCAEIVLPSIERDLSDADHQPKSFPDQTKQDPYLLQEDFNPRPRQHSEPFFTEFEGYQESPHSKRRRIADEQRFETHRADKTILVPLERIEDRPSMYGTPVEAVYSAGMRNVASDTGIAPLPSMKVARSPTSLRQVNTFGQPAQMDRQVILEERQQKHVLPRNHFQIPLSRNREKPQISLHAVHAPLKYHNDSPTILETSHFAPTYYENFDLHSPSRHDISAIPIDDRAFVKSREALQSTQWCGESQRSIPSQFEDLSVNYRQHQKYGNDMSRDPQTESGLHAVDTAAADDHEYSRQSIGGYLHKADLGRQGAVVNLGPAPHRMQPQPIWTVKRDVPTSGQQHSGTGRINPLETQGSGLESRSGEQDLYGDDTLADILIAKNANMQARKQYSSMSYGIMNSVRTETMAPMRQRKGPSDIVVLD